MLRETEPGGKQHQPSRKVSVTANLIWKQLCSTGGGRSESSSELLKGCTNCIVLRIKRITHSEKQNNSCPNFRRKIIINLGDFSIFCCLHVCVFMHVYVYVSRTFLTMLFELNIIHILISGESVSDSFLKGDGALFCLGNQIIYNNIFFPNYD